MDFSGLETYLKLVEEEQTAPSVFLALCMMESVIYDIEDDTGKNIEELDMGDVERLPSKLLFAMRTLGKIYSKKIDEMESVPVHLESKTAEIKKSAAELEKIDAQITSIKEELSDFAAKKAELDQKKGELAALCAEAESDKETCEKLNKEIAEREKKLGELSGFDLDGAVKTLSTVEENLRQKSAEKAHYDEIESECLSKKGELEKLCADAERGKETCNTLYKQIAELEKMLDELSGFDLDGAKKTLSTVQENLRQKRAEKAEYDEIESECLSKRGELEKLCADAESGKETCDKLNKEIAELEKKLGEMGVPDVAGKQALLETKQNEVKHKQEELAEEERLCEQIEAENERLSGLIEKAENARQKHEELAAETEAANKKLAEIGEFDLEEEKALRDETVQLAEDAEAKKKELDDLKDKKLGYIREIAELDKEKKELDDLVTSKQKQIDEKSAVNEALTQTCDSLTEELGTIQDNIVDLDKVQIPDIQSKKADAESRKEELEKELTALQELFDEADKLNVELSKNVTAQQKLLQEKEEENKSLQEDYKRLQQQVADKDNTLTEIQKNIDELKETADDEKFNTVLRQKQEEERKLNELSSNISKLTDEIKTLSEQSEKKQEDLKKYDENKAEIKQKLETLEPLMNSDKLNELRRLEEKNIFLSSVCSELIKVMKNISDELGNDRLDGNAAMLYNYSQTLGSVRSSLRTIREKIMEISDNSSKMMKLNDP